MKSIGGRLLLHLLVAMPLGFHSIPVWSQVVLGGDDLDRGVSVATTADGGFIVVGVTRSRGSGGEDVYLVRLDADAKVLWETAFGGPGDDDGWAVIEIVDGGFVVGGFSDGEGAGGLDCSLTATDPRGTPIWSQSFGGEKDDRCWSVVATADGGYALAGETASFGAGERDCYLIRTDGRGREIWSRTYGGERDDRCFSLVAVDDGGFVVAGQSFSYGAGDRDAWVLKTDRDGALEWSRTHGGTASDVAHSVVADGRGSYLVTGYTTSLAVTPDDPMVFKVADDGTIDWSRVLEMEGSNRTLTGAPAAGRGLCLAGFSVAGNPPSRSALIVKVDDAGRPLWSTEVLATARGESLGYGVVGTADGGCAITGHTTVGSAGGLDLLFAKTDAEGRPIVESGPAPKRPAAEFRRLGTLRLADGVDMAYVDGGAGEPALVFVHCGNCRKEIWEETLDAFAPTHRVVAMDLPGHGRSGANRSRFTIPDLGADVAALVEHLDLGKVILIGNSLGGPVSLEAARRLGRERVLGVVAVDTLHNVEAAWSDDDVHRRLEAYRRDFQSACDEMMVGLLPEEAPPAARARIERDTCDNDPRAAAALIESIPAYDQPASLAAAGVPVRAINSRIFPTAVEVNRKYAVSFEVILMDGVGHHPQIERPEEFRRHLGQVVAELAAAFASRGPG